MELYNNTSISYLHLSVFTFFSQERDENQYHKSSCAPGSPEHIVKKASQAKNYNTSQVNIIFIFEGITYRTGQKYNAKYEHYDAVVGMNTYKGIMRIIIKNFPHNKQSIRYT